MCLYPQAFANTRQPPPPFPPPCLVCCPTGTITVLRVEWVDAHDQELPADDIEASCDFIEDGLSSGNVLVHCAQVGSGVWLVSVEIHVVVSRLSS